MIVSANQPYFAPFPGFFYKAHLSDALVLLDRVQFPRGTTWMNRNRFKNTRGTLWMTVPVWKKGLGLQRIDEVRICHEGHWARKHFESLETAYAKAPYFQEHRAFLKEIFSGRFARIVEVNLEIITYLIDHLGIGTRVFLLSELGIEGRGSRLLIEICRAMGASRFLAQRAAQKYLEVEILEEAGIQVRYFNPPALVYPQLWGDFVRNLSAFDLLFNCGPKAHDILISG